MGVASQRHLRRTAGGATMQTEVDSLTGVAPAAADNISVVAAVLAVADGTWRVLTLVADQPDVNRNLRVDYSGSDANSRIVLEVTGTGHIERNRGQKETIKVIGNDTVDGVRVWLKGSGIARIRYQAIGTAGTVSVGVGNALGLPGASKIDADFVELRSDAVDIRPGTAAAAAVNHRESSFTPAAGQVPNAARRFYAELQSSHLPAHAKPF